MMNDWVECSRRHLSPALFYSAGLDPSILNRSIRAIFDTLRNSDCCGRPVKRAGSESRTPGTAPLHGRKLEVGAGRILLLPPRPRNRKSTIRRARSLRAALPAPLGAACPTDPA